MQMCHRFSSPWRWPTHTRCDTCGAAYAPQDGARGRDQGEDGGRREGDLAHAQDDDQVHDQA